MIKKTFFAAVLGGLIGGIAGAALAIHLARGATAVQPAIAVPAHPQAVVSATRIELRDTEGEAPSLVLNDAQQRAAGIFRLFGTLDTPVVVLKNHGRDRSVYGLNPNSTDPFLANYADDGTKSDVFGRY
jgi:hypothetical protein